MLTIHGVPLSVHTRKAIVTAILKGIDYKFEVVIPVIPDNPPPHWSTLSPTGLASGHYKERSGLRRAVHRPHL